MKVLFVPRAQNNPYQERLATALSEYDVHINMVNNFQRFPLLSSIRQAGKPDILHLHWTSPFWHHRQWYITLLAIIRFLSELLVIKILGIKIVWTVHNLHAHDSQNPQLEYRVNRIFCRLYDHIIVHCQGAQNAVQQAYRLPGHFQEKMSVIDHGNYVDYYENHISQSQARKQLEFSSEDIVFLFFGRVRPYKGIFQLVDAFNKQIYPHTHLLVVGRPANETIQEALEERCKHRPGIRLYLQQVPGTDIQLYMNAANLVILPFREVLTSGTVILAMSFGKAILIPRLGCVAEILDEHGCIFYDYEDPRGLEKALQRARSVDLSAMGKHNLSLVQSHRWDEIGQKTYQVYSQCLST